MPPSPHTPTSITNLLFFRCNSTIRDIAVAGKNPRDAFLIYRDMLRRGLRPNNFTYPFVIKACRRSSSVQLGLMVHARLLCDGFDADPFVQSSLIHMYAANKDIVAAGRVFQGSGGGFSSTVICNAMLDGFVKLGDMGAARSLFDRMDSKDVISWNTMINGYSILGELSNTRELFDEMPQRTTVSWNSMLAGYSKCGDVGGASKLFDEMPDRDVVSWNTMLACYAQNGRPNEALELFDEMERSGLRPTGATIVSLLSACSHLGALSRGERLHSYIDDNGVELGTILATALVDMYAKCGSPRRAYEVFRGIERKDILAWNTIISGFAMHGHPKDALRLFEEMTTGSGGVVAPDDITFVSVLCACAHSGMVEEGWRLLGSMKSEFGIDPKEEHYGCVIDLLSRAGLLQEATELTKSMPMKPSAPTLGALLGGCRIYNDVAFAEDVGRNLLNLQPERSGRYILFSNIYASANRWEDAQKVRGMMSTNGVAKNPGVSTIEIEGEISRFVSGDRLHPESREIYSKLAEISARLKAEAGYSPDTSQVFLDIEEEEKEQVLFYHSEKLALAYGLLHMNRAVGGVAVVRITKNLRACRDCHLMMKLVSRVYGVEIVVRDRYRFHLFKDGSCSCKDYW